MRSHTLAADEDHMDEDDVALPTKIDAYIVVQTDGRCLAAELMGSIDVRAFVMALLTDINNQVEHSLLQGNIIPRKQRNTSERTTS